MICNTEKRKRKKQKRHKVKIMNDFIDGWKGYQDGRVEPTSDKEPKYDKTVFSHEWDRVFDGTAFSLDISLHKIGKRYWVSCGFGWNSCGSRLIRNIKFSGTKKLEQCEPNPGCSDDFESLVESLGGKADMSTYWVKEK